MQDQIQFVEDNTLPINTKLDRYCWDGSTVILYEYSPEYRAYLLVSKTNGRTEAETIADYEEKQLNLDTQ